MARAHVLAAQYGNVGESYLLGSRDMTMLELVRLVHGVAGLRRPVLSVPHAIAGAAAHLAVAVARRTGKPPLFTPEAVRISRLGLRADCTKAVHRLGMEQSPLDRAVADALRWFALEGYIADRRLRHTILASSIRATTISREGASAAHANPLS
jgi:dihydroflavonol-4-reductase